MRIQACRKRSDQSGYGLTTFPFRSGKGRQFPPSKITVLIIIAKQAEHVQYETEQNTASKDPIERESLQ